MRKKESGMPAKNAARSPVKRVEREKHVGWRAVVLSGASSDVFFTIVSDNPSSVPVVVENPLAKEFRTRLLKKRPGARSVPALDVGALWRFADATAGVVFLELARLDVFEAVFFNASPLSSKGLEDGKKPGDRAMVELLRNAVASAVMLRGAFFPTRISFREALSEKRGGVANEVRFASLLGGECFGRDFVVPNDVENTKGVRRTGPMLPEGLSGGVVFEPSPRRKPDKSAGRGTRLLGAIKEGMAELFG